MISIEQMTIDDALLIKEIIAYAKVGVHEVTKMQNFAIAYVDSGIRICATCSSQIRFAHKRITDWHNRFEEQINLIIYKHTHQEQPETIKKEVSDLNCCDNCGKQLYDMRKSYCSKSCRDEFKKK